MQNTLKKISKILGYEGCEIFPKQTEILVERGDTGNFLNLPYFNGTKGLRYAINDNGSAATLEEFYKLYDLLACGRQEVEKIKIEEKKIEEEMEEMEEIEEIEEEIEEEMEEREEKEVQIKKEKKRRKS